MKNDETEEFMTAEEFFGIGSGEKGPRKAAKPKANSGKSRDGAFEELKIKTVMRIYGASRARALEIIAGRDGERNALAAAKEKAREAARRRREVGEEEDVKGFFGIA